MIDSPEIYFLKYARPCADFLEQRGEISKNDLDKLDGMIIGKVKPNRSYIEKIFSRAIIPLKEIAKEMSMDYWSLDVLKNYFRNEHNIWIDEKREGFEHLNGIQRDLCKVYEAKIMHVENDYYGVSINDSEKKVLKGHVLDGQINDVIFVHYLMAVEKK